MVRSAFGDREHQSKLPTTGCTRGYAKLDPLRRIKPCIAQCLPAEAGEHWEKWLAYSLQPAKAG